MQETLQLLKALSDRNRLRILSALTQYEELCACQITELLQISGPTVSRHLFILHNAGLVENRREGRWIFYRLRKEPDQTPLLQWIGNKISQSPDIKTDQQSLKNITSIAPEIICRKQRGEQCCPPEEQDLL